jgi:hypothetical protein
MRCEQARQLFDAYLDGELSAGQATEVGTHRLNCAECRRALALLEVSGHIIAHDRDTVAAPSAFTDRLLACMDEPHNRWVERVRRYVYYGVPLAAAAVIGLAFLGVFDRRPSGEARVLGRRAVSGLASPRNEPNPPARVNPLPTAVPAPTSDPNNRWMIDLQSNLDAVDHLNLTVLQWMEFLQELRDAQSAGSPVPSLAAPKVEEPDEPDEQIPAPVGPDIEDL